MEYGAGPVLFMEEDHFVAEDFLHVLWLQQQLVNDATKCSFCQKVRILSLGSYPKLFNHREASDMVIFLLVYYFSYAFVNCGY